MHHFRYHFSFLISSLIPKIADISFPGVLHGGTEELTADTLSFFSQQLHKAIGAIRFTHGGPIIISFKANAAVRLNVAGVDGRKVEHI